MQTKPDQTKIPVGLTGRGNLYTAICSRSDGEPILQPLGAAPRREFQSMEGSAFLSDFYFYQGVGRDHVGLGRYRLSPTVSLPGSELTIGDSAYMFDPDRDGDPAAVRERRRLSRKVGPLSHLCVQWNLDQLARNVAKTEKTATKSGDRWDGSVHWDRRTYSAAAEPLELQMAHCEVAHSALEFLRDHATSPVTIRANGPAAIEDFELLRSFGARLRFGVSLPSLRSDVLRAYEPETPSIAERLETLRRAKAEGLRVFGAIAPLYGDIAADDLNDTLRALLAIEPESIFCQGRRLYTYALEDIRRQARRIGAKVRPELNTGTGGLRALMGQFDHVTQLAREFGVEEKLRFWPPRELSQEVFLRTLSVEAREEHLARMERCHLHCRRWVASEHCLLGSRSERNPLEGVA